MITNNEPIRSAGLSTRPNKITEPPVAASGSNASNILAVVGRIYLSALVKSWKGMIVPKTTTATNNQKIGAVNLNGSKLGCTRQRPTPATKSPQPVILVEGYFWISERGIKVFEAPQPLRASPKIKQPGWSLNESYHHASLTKNTKKATNEQSTSILRGAWCSTITK